MKSKCAPSDRYRIKAWGLALGFAVLVGGSAHAANPVVNGNFENPLTFGSVNWKIAYVVGGPSDFGVRGRTTAARNGLNGFGAAFKPYHDEPMHAYFTQTISNLTAGASYAVTNWMHKPGGGDEAWYPKVHVYLETVGGLGSVTAEYFPDQNLINQNANQVWQQFVVTNTADALGTLEIRLHFNRSGSSSGDKWQYIDAWYDDVSMGLVSAPITNPPYRILSFSLANQTATIQWQTVSNQVYRIEASPALSTSNWTTFQDNLLATGTNLTFTTNVTVNPQYFRIHRL